MRNKFFVTFLVNCILFFSCSVEQMDGGFFERFGSGLKENIEEKIVIAEKDQFSTLTERELSKTFEEIAERTQLSYKELLSSLIELNVSNYFLNYIFKITV